MAKYIITVPNKEFNDVRIGVRFTNGVGEIDDINIAKRLKNDYGYDVSGLKTAEEKPEVAEVKTKKSVSKAKSKKTKKASGKSDMPEAGNTDAEGTDESESEDANNQG